MAIEGNHLVDLMDFSIDLELVKKIVFDDRLGQATIHFWRESPPPIITRSPLDRARLWSLCSADVCGLRSKAFDHNGISFSEIARGRSVKVEAKPAPAPERINLWNAVNDALYDFPKGNGVECADRVVGALERDKPTVLCVGNVLYFRQDRAIQDAKELRERAATLISSLRSVVDECMERIHRPKVRRATVSGSKPKRKPTRAMLSPLRSGSHPDPSPFS